jgi:hypothetical protein
MVDDRRVQREDTLYANAEADLSYGHGLAGSAVLPGDADALKRLKAFLVAFLDANMHAERVARLKSGNVVL